jgi:putative PIN family toxin of toxin-antitoxin system
VKVVLDTNVFLSGVFFSGPPFKILQAWRDGKIQMVICAEILDEYQHAGRMLAWEHPAIDLEPMLAYVVKNAVVISAAPLPESVCEDPHDDKFLACALASGCKLIISGDRHLLKVSGYKMIDVLKPRDFLDKFLQ